MSDKGARWFVAGDIDGFFGLALDNLIQLLVIVGLCRVVLGFDDALLLGRVLPGVALSVLVGNLYYAWQAHRLARETGRDDVTALPYGINTVSLFAFIFLVMLPAKLVALSGGATEGQAVRAAWTAGVLACLGSGLIEFGGSFVAEFLRKLTPRAAMLSTLAGIALGFISIGFLFRTFATPLVGFLPLGVVLMVYFGKVRFPARIPGGLVAVVLGVVLAWATGLCSWDPEQVKSVVGGVGVYPPIPAIGAVVEALRSGYAGTYLAVIVPMGLINLIGSLQNIESAEAGGDSFPTGPSLAVNGVGSIVAALFGSCFPTTIYIGHPGWKGLGARVGYSILDGLFVSVLCLTGTIGLIAYLVPIEAGMAIVLWIGLVMAAQAFQATPRAHAPAAVVGILPGVAAWGALMLKGGLRAGGAGIPGQTDFGPHLLAPLMQADIHAHGVFALEQGFVVTAMIWSAATVNVIERKFVAAALWCVAAAVCSIVGLIHSYTWTASDTVVDLRFGPGWPWALAYLLLGVLFLAGHFLPRDEGPGH
jgi:AGZA family xanthine/uracil permease-like MFS transporter